MARVAWIRLRAMRTDSYASTVVSSCVRATTATAMCLRIDDLQRRVRQGRKLALAKACGVASRPARSRRHGGTWARRHDARDARLRRADGRARTGFSRAARRRGRSHPRAGSKSPVRLASASPTCATCLTEGRRVRRDLSRSDVSCARQTRVAAQVGAGVERSARCGGRRSAGDRCRIRYALARSRGREAPPTRCGGRSRRTGRFSDAACGSTSTEVRRRSMPPESAVRVAAARAAPPSETPPCSTTLDARVTSPMTSAVSELAVVARC